MIGCPAGKRDLTYGPVKRRRSDAKHLCAVGGADFTNRGGFRGENRPGAGDNIYVCAKKEESRTSETRVENENKR